MYNNENFTNCPKRFHDLVYLGKAWTGILFQIAVYLSQHQSYCLYHWMSTTRLNILITVYTLKGEVYQLCMFPCRYKLGLVKHALKIVYNLTSVCLVNWFRQGIWAQCVFSKVSSNNVLVKWTNTRKI